MSDRSTVITPPGDNGWVYDPKRNEIDFISTSKASLYTYSLNTAAFTETLAIGGAPRVIAITPDSLDVVVGNQGTMQSGGKDYLSLTRVNLDTNGIEQLLTPATSANGAAIYHLAIDANGVAVFVYSPSMYDKGYMSFAATAPAPSIQDYTAFNAFLINGNAREFGQDVDMIASPDHRFLLVQDHGGSGLTLYDSASSAFVSILDPYHRVGGSQSGRGDITNSGMIVDVTPQSVVVFDRNLNVLKDLSQFQQDPLSGAVFSQDARQLFVWDQAHKSLFVFDTQTWAKTATLTTSSGGIYNYFDVPGHSMQIVDHGAMLALDDGVHGMELIDLNAKFGLTAGPAPTSPPPMAPLGQTTAPAASHGAAIRGDMDQAQLSDLLNSTIIQADAGRFAAAGAGVSTIALQGTGLTYVNDQLVGGTVNWASFVDLRNGTTILDFNITGGAWSASQFQTWLVTNNTSAAFQTLLAGDDNISGGTGNDLIRAYAGNDLINGLGGADTLFGGAGDDVMYATSSPTLVQGVATTASTYMRGEDGDDFMVGGIGFDDMNGNMGRDTVSGGQGDDWVVGGQGNDQLFGDGGSDIVYGNLGDDTCTGGDGADFVRGGQANDVLYGEAGNDWMSGDRGDDTISGGSGADTFYIFAGSGLDRITDFSRAEGDRVQLDPGTRYTVNQDGADTVIDLGGGDRMVLVGVQASGMGSGWVIGA